MKISTIIWIVVIVLVLVGLWYWWTNTPTPPDTGPATSTTTTTGAGTEAGSGYAYVPGNLLLGTDATTTLGTYLIADNGMTLYKYASDTADTSNCTGDCATTWPPYTIDSADELTNLQAGIGGKAGFITRDDGSMQVTYNGMPVYFYTGDQVSGDTNGQGVGGQWSIITP